MVTDKKSDPTWQPISTAPCDDTLAWVRWRDGKETVEDLDHDSIPDWWAGRGATHWRDVTDAEARLHAKPIDEWQQTVLAIYHHLRAATRVPAAQRLVGVIEARHPNHFSAPHKRKEPR
jgi:hypothetical protein